MKILRSDSQWIGDVEVADDELVVATTRDELATIAGALNEVLEAIEGWEFHARLGATPEQVRTLRDRTNEVLRRASRSE